MVERLRWTPATSLHRRQSATPFAGFACRVRETNKNAAKLVAAC
jgi:hypothetical protein